MLYSERLERILLCHKSFPSASSLCKVPNNREGDNPGVSRAHREPGRSPPWRFFPRYPGFPPSLMDSSMDFQLIKSDCVAGWYMGRIAAALCAVQTDWNGVFIWVDRTLAGYYPNTVFFVFSTLDSNVCFRCFKITRYTSGIQKAKNHSRCWVVTHGQWIVSVGIQGTPPCSLQPVTMALWGYGDLLVDVHQDQVIWIQTMEMISVVNSKANKDGRWSLLLGS